MHPQYEKHYLAVVREMIERGVELYLLDGSAVRTLNGSMSSPVCMTKALREQVRGLCRGSLALSSGAAEVLYKREKSGPDARTNLRRAITTRI